MQVSEIILQVFTEQRLFTCLLKTFLGSSVFCYISTSLLGSFTCLSQTSTNASLPSGLQLVLPELWGFPTCSLALEFTNVDANLDFRP